jgi:NAD(P)-dependent dehydrogenase (short-subunit alcohol dehydrogenase family)
MNKALDGRTALVTGASRGLGRAIARRLHRDGANVIAAARASTDLDQLGAELGSSCRLWAGDVTSDAFLEFIAAQKAINLLINNAGTNAPKPMEQVDDETLDRLLDLNVRTTFRVSRSVLAAMPKGGRIINITSQMGHVGSPDRTVYCMTKHAIEGLTKAMAVELAPRGNRVNSVAPTFVETPMTAPMLSDPKFAAFVKQMIPLGTLAKPDDVAEAVAFLCSDGAGMITGHSLLVDGGWTAQ